MLKKSLSIGLLAFLVLSLCAFSMGAKESEVEATAIKLANDVMKGDYKLVSTTDLNKWVEAKKPMLIVDTMPFEDSFKKEHIPGAICFELPIPEMKEMDAALKEKFEKAIGADKNRTLVFYCGFTKCGRSHNGAMWAKKLGYTDVWRCPGGIKAWKEQGFKADKA